MVTSRLEDAPQMVVVVCQEAGNSRSRRRVFL
jgi:hypothetical protein